MIMVVGLVTMDWSKYHMKTIPKKKSILFFKKEEMISTIHKTFDETIALISKFDISKLNDRLDYLGLNRTKRQIFLLLADHITHHRGQMLVSLRLNGLVPPRYIFYQ